MIKTLFLCLALAAPPVFSGEKNGETENYSISTHSVLDFKDVKEGSSLTGSRTYKQVYWTINDSGHPPAIYPLDAGGKMIKPEWTKTYKGVKILDALNIDWEWLTSDGEGNLLIGDTGNNNNYRRDLAFYLISEPNPYMAVETGITAKYPLRYPDQDAFPPDEENFNFDAEAAYYYEGRLYLITKNRSDTLAKIYKFGELKPWQMNVPEISGTFDFGGMVSDAEVSPDKSHLAVLTYDYVWLFERPESGDFFKGRRGKKEIKLGQCEGIAFDGDKLLISNEQRHLFKIKFREILK